MRAKAFHERCNPRTGTFRAIRREASRLYHAWVARQITSEELRAGSLALTRMADMDQGRVLDERIAASTPELDMTRPAKPNGRDQWSGLRL